MTVAILNQKEKEELTEKYIHEGRSKVSLAREWGVSERTVGRIITEMKDQWTVSSTEDVTIDEDDVVQYESDEVFEYQFVATKDSISITKIGYDSVHTEVVSKDHENYSKAYQIIASGLGSEESLAEAFTLISKKEMLKVITQGRVTLDTQNHKLVVDGDVVLPNSLYEKIIYNYQNGLSVDKLIKFAEHLSDNISNRIVNRLYDFISHNSVEITDDGMIICYKKITDDYKDVHTKTFDNSVGTTVQVKRNQVDEDMDKTCSYGLHVCSAYYLPHFGGTRVVKVLLDPADVVSIPSDYNFSKIRCCKYIVLEDVTNQYNQGLIK